MHVVIANQTGRIHHAAQHPELRIIRPCYAFIPQEHFQPCGFNRRRHLESRWPEINAGANPHAIGSHTIPDAEKPVESTTRCPVLREFLIRLQAISAVKAISPTNE